jgi:V8-like Glu-specific endopeptidase
MRRAALTLTAGLVAAVGFAAAASGSVLHEVSDPGSAKRSIREFWTPERLRAAEPRDLASPAGAARPPLPAAAGAGAPPGSIPASGPTVGRAVLEPRAGAQPPSRSGRAYEVVGPGRPPNTVHGKVFGKDRAGTFECSATAVTSTNRSVVFTAGHCVHLKPYGWARKFVFIPSYNHGRRPFGTWTWEVMLAPGSWIRREHQNFDMAAVVLAPQDGVPVQDAVGGAGFGWNQPRDQVYRSFGYPSNFFAAQRMMGCRSGARNRTIDFGKGPAMVAMSCDMGSGSSGGAWLTGDGLLTSVQSLGGGRNLAAGPYFGKAARRLLFRAQAE